MSPKKEAPQPGKKRPYRAPTLIVHGDLRDLAKLTDKGGTQADGSKPSSRLGGQPA